MFPQIFGKYVLEREIASGGMAVVYLATLRGAGGFEKRLVVKQIRAELASDDAFVRRFVDEAKTSVELSHPNIVPVYELGVEQGVYYIAMELAEGVTLAELLGVEGSLSAEEGAYLGVEICRALDYAHRRAAIVHRDITPRNVLIDAEGAVRVIDFGIAAPVAAEGSVARQKVFGSPGHMPFEQIQGGRLTPATDVFAVGALLIETWTGVAPFRRETASASEAAVHEAPPPLSSVVPELSPLDALIAGAVALDAKDRPQSAEELARPLRRYLKAAELGDVARRLGGRVERATNVLSGRPKPSAVSKTPATLGMARPDGDSSTRTFAAGAEIRAWTRRYSSRPPPPDPEQDLEPAARDVHDGRASEVSSPEAGEGGKRRVSDRPTPILAATSDERTASNRAKRWWGAAFVVAAVAMGIGFAAWPRVSHVSRPEDGGPAHASVARTPSRTLTPTMALPVTTREIVSTRSSPPAATRDEREQVAAIMAKESVASPTRAAAESSARREEPGTGVLNLTSDLPATVNVAGRAVGATPLQGLRRPEGRYQVSFVNADLDERVATMVDLGAGQTLGVHAEFKRAAPTVLLRR